MVKPSQQKIAQQVNVVTNKSVLDHTTELPKIVQNLKLEQSDSVTTFGVAANDPQSIMSKMAVKFKNTLEPIKTQVTKAVEPAQDS